MTLFRSLLSAIAIIDLTSYFLTIHWWRQLNNDYSDQTQLQQWEWHFVSSFLQQNTFVSYSDFYRAMRDDAMIDKSSIRLSVGDAVPI